MSAMEEAFARVGIMRRQATGQKPTLVLSPIPRRTPTIKDRMLEDRAAYAAMTDDELAFEQTMLNENLEAVRIELRLQNDGEVERPRDWRPRAERAVSLVRGRLALCRLEIDKRKRAADEQRRVYNEQQRAALEQETIAAHQRKLEVIAAANGKERQKLYALMRNMKRLLPAETLAEIWAAVDADMAGSQ